jgi:archaemetzincin
MSRTTPKKTWLTAGLGIAVCGLVIAQFTPFSKHERAGAAGSLDGLDAQMARAFSDEGEFRGKTQPGPGDWLAQHREAGQTYAQYLKSRPNRPDSKRRVIYILPLGDFEGGSAPELETLRAYTAEYYSPLQVVTLPAVTSSHVKARSRTNESTEKKQWNSEDILEWMKKMLPSDAYAMLAVTMTDLYPKESWNYVFGQASLKHRVGVFSFARYDPLFWNEETGEGTKTLVLQRAAKVLTHETGHMFGFAHCTHFECNMNGSNNLPETDGAPMHLCPVCLRKLHYALGFDPVARYQRLSAFYLEHELKEEAGWLEKRLAAIKEAK